MGQIKLIEDNDQVVVEGKFKCCSLWKNRNNVVWIRGTCYKDADVLFVGEAPGKEEDLQGKPFVGRAGNILEEWIKKSGIEKFAIINVIKCRPPNNRIPSPSEIRACLPNFTKQIKELNPKLIIALGRIAMSVLVNRTDVTANVGKLYETRYGKVFILFHPSYILRGANVYIPIKELRQLCKNLNIEIRPLS